MVEFLKDDETRLPDEWVAAGINSVRTIWGSQDPESALRYFANSSVLKLEEREKTVSGILYVAPLEVVQDRLLNIVDGLEDQELATRLKATEPYILASLHLSPGDAYANLAGLPDAERRKSLSKVTRAIRRLPDSGRSDGGPGRFDYPGEESNSRCRRCRVDPQRFERGTHLGIDFGQPGRR